VAQRSYSLLFKVGQSTRKCTRNGVGNGAVSVLRKTEWSAELSGKEPAQHETRGGALDLTGLITSF